MTGSLPSTETVEFFDYAKESEPWFRGYLQEMVEHRTVSPGGQNFGEIREGAQAAARLMRDCGAEVELVESSGTPSILGRFAHPSPRSRIIVYNHFDVQPADPEGWDQSDPFRFEVREDADREFYYLGRGTTDDKGPALCGLRAASQIAAKKLPIEIVLLWETEEEIGSPNFPEVLKAKRDVLKADAVVVSDTIWPSGDQPAISSGLRGGVTASLHLQSGNKDVHSGLVGGVARNPLRELSKLVAAIDNAAFWRRDVAVISNSEIEGFLRSGFDPHYFRAAHELLNMETDVSLEMMLRLWARPTFEVHGYVGGYSGPGIKSAVPPRAEVKVSFRTVPDQDSDLLAKDLVAFVHQINPQVEVCIESKFRPYRAPLEGLVHRSLCKALEVGFGKVPAIVREGGSIGAVPQMQEILELPVHFLPLSLPEHGYHAPNERFDWKQARGGIVAFCQLFSDLAVSR